MIFRLFRAFAMLDVGCSCRRCGESIRPSDQFGLSEGVCAPCRLAPLAGLRYRPAEPGSAEA